MHSTRHKSTDVRTHSRWTKRPSHVSPTDPRMKELQDKLLQEQTRADELRVKLVETQRMLTQKAVDYEEKIKSLQAQLRAYHQCPSPTRESMMHSIETVEKVHKQVLDSISEFKSEYQTEFELKERDLLRSFDHKLTQLCNQFEERRKQKTQEISQIVSEEKHKSKEFELLKGASYMLNNKNKQLQEENTHLRTELENRDAEFHVLMNKYLTLKRRRDKENRQADAPATSYPVTPHARHGNYSADPRKFNRYEGIIERLRKQLELERKNLRAARTAYSRELESKTELEKLLRTCVDEIRAEITKKRGTRRGESEDDRKLIVDRLLATEEVLRQLYDKAFPLNEGMSRGSAT